VNLHPAGQFDNAARAYAHIAARPLAAAMGAEIEGVDLAHVTDAQFAEVRDALFRHKMIYFRDQAITHADQEAFARRFGPFAEDAYTQGVPGHPDVQPLIKEAGVRPGMLFGRVLRPSAFKAKLKSVSTKDAEGLLNAGDGIDNACEKCHLTYWYPNEAKNLAEQQQKQ